MKKMFSLGTSVMIILSLIGISTYFYISFFQVKSSIDEIKEETIIANAELSKISDSEAFLSEDDKRYYELKKELEQVKSQSTEGVKGELESFLNEYDTAMDYELGSINGYKAKQDFIRNQLSPFFTDKAFEQAGYEKIVTAPDTQNVTNSKKQQFVLETNIKNSNKNIVRIYYQSGKPENGNIILKISDEFKKSEYKYQLLAINKPNGKYIIYDYQDIKADMTAQ